MQKYCLEKFGHGLVCFQCRSSFLVEASKIQACQFRPVFRFQGSFATGRLLCLDLHRESAFPRRERCRTPQTPFATLPHPIVTKKDEDEKLRAGTVVHFSFVLEQIEIE